MKGIFLLDIEVELAWGVIDQRFDKSRMTSASRNIRKHLNTVIFLLEKHQIPVTWGILGHVALQSCKRSILPHPNMPRPSYRWLRQDWYQHDPCREMEAEPAFYGKDIVDQIVDFASKNRVPHDIACHSFSHQLFGDPGCTEEVAEAEIRQSLMIMNENYGIRPKVFIFPRDSVGHLAILRENGFIAFRGPISHTVSYSETDRSVVNMTKRDISLASYLVSFYIHIPPPTVTIKEVDGLRNIPGSMCFNKKPFIPLSLIALKAKKGIRKAVQERNIFHLYTHLINFGQAPDVRSFLKEFEDVLAYANHQRTMNKLETATMRSLSESNLE